MFFYNSCVRPDWDVSSVKNMKRMFMHSVFNGDICHWTVAGVKDMSGMFSYSEFNGDLSDREIRAIDTSYMFRKSKSNGRL